MEQYAAKQPENPDERVKGNIRSRKIHEGSGTFVRKRKKRAAERHAFPQKRKEEKKKRRKDDRQGRDKNNAVFGPRSGEWSQRIYIDRGNVRDCGQLQQQIRG